MSTVDILVKAIEEKKSVDFGYHGFERVVSPYAVGLNNANEIKLLALQTEGGSNSGVTRKLRFYTVNELLAPTMCDAPYEAPTAEVEPALKEFMKFYAKF